MKSVLPEPVASHFVVIRGRRFPPKQVIEILTGLDRADFTSHHARRILTGLGFTAGRAQEAGSRASALRKAATPRGAEALRPFLGQWVAVKDDEVLVAAGKPQEVVAWLASHDRRADSVFRVPADDASAAGLAPL